MDDIDILRTKIRQIEAIIEDSESAKEELMTTRNHLIQCLEAMKSDNLPAWVENWKSMHESLYEKHDD